MEYQYLNTEEMMALETHAFENFDISIEEMMQNAGKAIFDVIVNEVLPHSSKKEPHVLIVTGKGNNGGDALVTARLLSQLGIEVTVLNPYSDDELTDMARAELEKIKKLDLPLFTLPEEIKEGDYTLVVDALFGFSLSGNPKPPADEIIEQINCSKAQVLSVDVPSGLDVYEGVRRTPVIEADYTITLGMPKKGLDIHKTLVGKLFLGDLGIPKKAYEDKGYETPDFRGKSYISVN